MIAGTLLAVRSRSRCNAAAASGFSSTDIRFPPAAITRASVSRADLLLSFLLCSVLALAIVSPLESAPGAGRMSKRRFAFLRQILLIAYPFARQIAVHRIAVAPVFSE